jgi:N-carbamoyl-L-amino-acid hydrolase
VGRIVLDPGQINVVARRAVVALDIRNPSEILLDEAEWRLRAFLADAAVRHGVEVSVADLARFPAVAFDPGVIAAVEDAARRLGHDPRRMVSGAGHDAQIMAGICPAGMIFVPSIDGLSHNPAEMTRPEHLVAGAQVLLQAALALAES